MAELIMPQPSDKQKLFLEDRHKYVGYGGARGGGKSWVVRWKAVLLAMKHAGIKIMIVRRSYPELQENHILPLCEMLMVGTKDALAKYNDSKKHLVFPNGSRILFRYCETDKDTLRFQGTEVDVLFVDEATQQSEDKMDRLKACVRGVNEFPKRIYYTCNPGGEGHGWMKRLFIDREYKEGEKPEDYAFIQALVTDNKALMESDPDYYNQLLALPPKLRAAWLEGRWDIFEGQFFEDFCPTVDMASAEAAGCTDDKETLLDERRWVHVIPAFDISEGECAGWNIIRSYDFGYGKPFSCGWWAIDYEGVMYRVMELYGCTGEPNEGRRWTPDQQFAEIARIEREHPWFRGRNITGVADPSIWDKSRGESINDSAVRHGVYFTPGDNARIAGWMQCHYRLQFDSNGRPRMYVFDNCKDFIRTIPLLVYDEHKVEDVDTDLEDHIADEWRYAAMSRPVKPLRPVARRKIFNDPLDQFKDMRRR